MKIKFPPTFPPPSRGGVPEHMEFAQYQPPVAADFLSEEQNALLSSSPPRSLWPELARFDERRGRIEERPR